MPIRKTQQGYWWGGQGPFPTREKAESVEVAANASGYRPKREVKNEKQMKDKKR